MSEWRKLKLSSQYKVSDDGRVRGPWGILNPTLMQIGYYSIAISLGNSKVVRRYVHRLVAEAFIGEIPKNYVVNHKNNNKLDNRTENLEIVSRSRNAKQWATLKRSSSAGRKRTGHCGRGHKLVGNRVYCNECARLRNIGFKFLPPDDTEWRETSVSGYLVSRDGRLWSTKTTRVLRPGINGPGYHYFNLRINGKTKPFAIHRLVAEAFIRPVQDSEVVDHISGDKLDNRVANLHITTRSNNTLSFRDRVRHKGAHGFKLSEEDVLKINKLLNKGEHTQKEIGNLFSVGASIISAIKTKRKWKHVAEPD